jgi:hypothetical protein
MSLDPSIFCQDLTGIFGADNPCWLGSGLTRWQPGNITSEAGNFVG